MTLDFCAECAKLLDGTADDTQAVRVEEAFPHCGCEKYKVGRESPGPVDSAETVYRMVVSPAYIDWNARKILADSFRNAASNGLSVFRECATDDDVAALAIERLSRKANAQPRTVQAIVKFKVELVRGLKSDSVDGRLFCVYDETVPRRDEALPRVPTHVTILQRLPAAKVASRKQLIRDGYYELFKLAEAGLMKVEDFRNGILDGLNKRSLQGDFILPEQNVAA